jgi:hypothetical protein
LRRSFILHDFQAAAAPRIHDERSESVLESKPSSRACKASGSVADAARRRKSAKQKSRQLFLFLLSADKPSKRGSTKPMKDNKND